MWNFFLTAWNEALIPSVVALAAVFGFAKLFLEKQKLQLEISRLKREEPTGIHRPTTDEVQRYSQRSRDQLEQMAIRLRTVQTTIRVSAAIVAVLLPTSLYLVNMEDTEGPTSTPPRAARAFEDVYFVEGDFMLTDEATRSLDDIAAALRGQTTPRVVIEGHTRSTGTSESNLALAERRANVVRDYLVGRGVPADQLATVSYGEERPQFDNVNPDTQPLNDRVTFRVEAPEPRD